MDVQDRGQNEHNNGESISMETVKTKLQLPLSCDPPGPNNPPKQLIWIVSALYNI